MKLRSFHSRIDRALATILITAAAGLSALVAHAAPADPDTLKVALIPEENPSTIIQSNQAFKEYLERATGKKIELVVTLDYSAMFEAARFKRIDLGYYGPMPYVMAKSKADIEPLAALVTHGTPSYQGCIIASKAGGVRTLGDVRGKTFGFTDPASTAGHLLSRLMLLKLGMVAGKDYQYQFLNGHDALVLAVQNNRVQAGATTCPLLESFIQRKIVDPARLEVIARTSPIPNYPWAVRADLSPPLKEKLRTALLTLKDPRILTVFHGEGFAPISDKDFDGLREAAEKLDIDTSGKKK
ncbi:MULTISPECIES: phosphate/phosphite/phosphonate ABC transporter substrate-binding protein [unclassified Burkholderia]|uniref:phosphate/phosphite/phosphonate ABC transporter substrate-binding protein n=1 Tax=unclassified Burkholderia TaxID=2613784 RepID=UPI001624A6C0|nr:MULTISPECIES: phosphate/phosphite/phosphonate ABC transporter substrate-binding protein [unclassified Burkholderia]